MVGEPSLQILNKLQGLTSDKRSTVQAQYRQQLYPAHVRTLHATATDQLGMGHSTKVLGTNEGLINMFGAPSGPTTSV